MVAVAGPGTGVGSGVGVGSGSGVSSMGSGVGLLVASSMGGALTGAEEGSAAILGTDWVSGVKTPEK